MTVEFRTTDGLHGFHTDDTDSLERLLAYALLSTDPQTVAAATGWTHGHQGTAEFLRWLRHNTDGEITVLAGDQTHLIDTGVQPKDGH